MMSRIWPSEVFTTKPNIDFVAHEKGMYEYSNSSPPQILEGCCGN
jgi:hypothetical protein